MKCGLALRKTQELMLTNRKLGAREALDWGLIDKVSPPSSLLDDAIGLADIVAHGAPGFDAVGEKLLLAAFGNGLETQMGIEGRCIAE